MLAEPITVIISQHMEILHALNLCTDVCQLFLNKLGGKKQREGIPSSFTRDSSTRAAGVFLDLPGGDADAHNLVGLRVLM